VKEEFKLNNRVVILGAGISGLSVAHKLAENGKNVIVLENEPCIGGLAGNIERNDCFIDYGPHTFFLDERMQEEFYRIIDRKEVNTFKANALIKYDDQYYSYPLDAIDILIKSRPFVLFKFLLDYSLAKAKMIIKRPIDDSAESWIINRFGKSLYKMYFEKYTEKVWGLHPKNIAASFVEEGIPLLNLRKTFKTSIVEITKRLLKKEDKTKFPYFFWGHYPKKGPMAFFNKLANKVCINNGIIYLNSQVKSINLDGLKVIKVSFEKDGDIKTLESEAVVSTIPINDLVKLIIPRVDSNIFDASKSLKFRAVIFVNLIVKKKDILEARMIYVRNRTFNRITEMNKFSKDLFPEGLTGLCTEIACDKDHELWNTDEKKLCNRVINELEEEGLIKKDDVVDAFVTRKENGYPVADLHYEKNRKLLYDYIGSIENLFVTGRQGLFRYLHMDQCMKMGIDVAENILKKV
jgi:protoporphyrinogen oxidase